MTRLVHLTDLHFGVERGELVAPLAAAVRENRPDLVVVSGDLTQRSRRGQFVSAMAFLRGLELPLMLIPGNHDIPLFNVISRLIAPYRGYRRAVSRDLAPALQLGGLRLFGTNTVNPWRVRSGVLRPDEVERIATALRRTAGESMNILVCHHPIEEPPGFDRGETRGAREGIERLLDAGLHGVLSGHLHAWQFGLGITGAAPRRLLQVQTGTALCGRLGERDHGFSVLDITAGHLGVTPWGVDESALAYIPLAPRRFALRGGLWHLES